MSRGAADGESSLEQNLPVQLPQKVLEEQEKQSGEEPPGVEGADSTLSRSLEGFLQKLNPPHKKKQNERELGQRACRILVKTKRTENHISKTPPYATIK